MRKPGGRRMRIRRIAAVLLAGSCIAGCTGAWAVPAQETEAEDERPAVKKIAVYTCSYSSEYWGYVEQGCKAYDASNPSVVVDVKQPSSSIAADEQNALLKTDLELDRYDGYVIAAINQEKTQKVLQNVTFPVIALNSPLEASCVIGEVSTDNEAAAKAGAKKAVKMAQNLGRENPECVMIGGIESDFNQINRLEGFRKGIEENGGVWLDAIYPTDKSADSARAAMDQIMKEYPDGVAIVACYNDTLAMNALEESLEHPAFADTVFLGFDGNGSICEQIMNDDKYQNMVTVAQNPYEMGFRAVERMAQYLETQDTAKKDGKDADTAAPKDGKAAAQNEKSAAPSSSEGDTSGNLEESGWEDSGYAVINRDNAQERMLQIANHLS